MEKDYTKREFILKVTILTSFVGFLFYALLYSLISVKILYPAIITVAIFLFLDAIIYILYLKKFYELAKHSILVLLVLTISYLIFYILGPKPGVQYFYLAFTILPLVLLSYKRFTAWILYILINLALFIWAEIFLEEIYNNYHMPDNVVITFKVITICFMVAAISFALWIIYIANRNSELELSEKASELEALNNDLQEKNKEIIKKESKLQEINLLLQGHLKDMEIQQVLLTNANATKDKFFSIIAHDLKNPVSSIMGFAQILATKFDELDSEKVKLYTELLYDSSISVNELMQNLLQWSRTQRGSIEIKKESFLIHPLLSKNTSLQKLAAEQKGLELEFSCPEDLRVFADYNMIDTAIRNLLSNAIKFTPKGGSIKLTGSQKEDKIVIAISDTGRGMDADEVKKLFLIDQSFSKEGTEGEKGTGLGLIIVKEFISKNEGQIRVESEKDRGTTFTISLPTNTPNN